jgi:cytochrome c553
MPRWNHAAILILMAATAGCVGTLDPMTGGDGDGDGTGDGDGDGTGQTARKMFDEDVSPALESACAACHAGTGTSPYKFMGVAGPADNYAKIEADPSMNGGWNPDASQFFTHTHTGGEPELTAAQKTAVRNWLVQEAMERNVDDQPPPATGDRTARDALARWAACMDQNDWVQSGMAQWADKASAGGGCKSCHAYGAGGFIAVADDIEMFNMNRYEIFIGFFFKAQAAAGGTFEVVANDSRACAKSDQPGHPSYICPDNYVQNLTNFVILTKGKLAACTATPGFVTPPAPPAQQ